MDFKKSNKSPLTLNQLKQMNGKLVWIEKYKTVGIVCIKRLYPNDPLVLFWDGEEYMLSILGNNLKVYEYLYEPPVKGE